MRALPLLLVPLGWLQVPDTARAPGAPRAHGAAPRAEAPCAHAFAGECLPEPRCGTDELDLDGLCVPTASGSGEVEGAVAETNAHIDRLGHRVVYEHLPRRQDLPTDYDRYVYPTGPGLSGGHFVSSGYDLDRPDALQRRGESLSAVGHGGVDLPEARGALVRVVALRGEVGDPAVLYVGHLFGNTVVLRHTVRERGRLRVYLALHGHLERPAPGLVAGQALEPGTVLGFVGDSGALGVVHLHYETRLLRPGVDPTRVDPGRLTDQAVSVPCDPRNVLPLR